MLPGYQKLLCLAQQNLEHVSGLLLMGFWCRIPVAGEDRGRPCSLRKGIGYRRLVHARSVGGQPSQETVSESAGRATYSRSVNSPLGRHRPTHLTAEVDIVLKFCPGSNSGQLEQGKKNKKKLVC